jgi:uncharacterized protein (DUF736 family)
MATIGHLLKNADGTLTGQVNSTQRSVKLRVEPNREKDGDQSPDYRIFAVTSDAYCEIGGAWTKQHEGRSYLSMSMDDPDWKSPLSCAAFPAKDRPNEYDVVWNRPQRAAA